MGFRNSLSGSGFAVLNVIRALNIIAFLLTMAASMVMLVVTIKVSHFYVFDGVAHFIVFSVSIFLFLTEIDIFKGYFARNWPLLSINHGFCMLALVMIAMAVSTLANLNKDDTSSTHIGSAFYQLVMAAGILTLIMGFTNLVANFVFRNSKQGVTARMVRAHGKQAQRFASMTGPVDPVIAEHGGISPQRTGQSMQEAYPTGNKYAASSFYSSPSVRSGRTAHTDHTVLPSRSASYKISAPMPNPDHYAPGGPGGEQGGIPRPPSAVHPALRQQGTPF